jgi:hypothetical protein
LLKPTLNSDVRTHTQIRRIIENLRVPKKEQIFMVV